MVPSIAAVMYKANESHVIVVDAAHTCYENMRIISVVMKDGNGSIQQIACDVQHIIIKLALYG